jgi:hypothetical protein
VDPPRSRSRPESSQGSIEEAERERSALVKRRLAWGGLILVVLSALMAAALNELLYPDGKDRGDGRRTDNAIEGQPREAERQAQEIERQRQARGAEQQAQDAERQRQDAERQAQEAERQRQNQQSEQQAQEAERQRQEAERQAQEAEQKRQAQVAERAQRAEREAKEAQRQAQLARQRRLAEEARTKREVGGSPQGDSQADVKRRLQEQLNRDVMQRKSPF